MLHYSESFKVSSLLFAEYSPKKVESSVIFMYIKTKLFNSFMYSVCELKLV